MARGRFRCCIVALCLVALTACGNPPDDPDTSGATLPTGDTPTASAPADSLAAFGLGYSKEDTLNPYATQTEVNLQLATLLYDSLTVVDNEFFPQLSLATSVEVTDPTHLVATLRPGAVFSDGSPVTVADVTTSFWQAKASANYKVLLTGITTAAADAKAGTVTFTLASPDPYAKACLSFPIIKASTLTHEAGKAPVGGGTYYLVSDDSGTRLEVNPHSSGAPRFSTVTLHHLPNSENLYYGLSSGEISYYFDDLSSGTVPRVTGASVSVNMNALLFIGMRSDHPALSQPAVRDALSRGLDRTAIVGSACAGWATPSDQPFHPAGYTAKELNPTTPKRDLEGAIDALQQAGYGGDKPPLKLELIYSTDKAGRGVAAELIRSQWEGAGVTVTLTPLTYEEYLGRLNAGQYDLYLGEVQLAANLSLQPLFSGAASYGVDRAGHAATVYSAYLAGDNTLEDFLTAFGEDKPFLPLCWRGGFAAYDRRLTTVTPAGYNPYYHFAHWE